MTSKTSPSDGYTITPLSPVFHIREMRQLIAQWRMAGLSDSQVIKMQLLYYGEPAWMNLDKTYDCTRFIHIVKGMKFRTTTDLLEVVLKCKGFGYIWKDSQAEHKAYNLLAFYTPLWHKEKKEDMDDARIQHEGNAEMRQVYPEQSYPELQQSDRYIPTKDIYDKKKNIKKKNNNKINTMITDGYTSGRSGATDGGCTDATDGNQPPSPQTAAERDRQIQLIATQTLQSIAQDDDTYTQIVKPINELTQGMMKELFCDMQQPHPMNLATRTFFNNYVYPYMLEHSEKMMSIKSTVGRSCWIRNLLKLDFMQKNICHAVNDARQYLAEHADELRRQYRPISPHEYLDQASGQRFYDTHDDQGTPTPVRIPHDAPPRPSQHHKWDKWLKRWQSVQSVQSV